MALIITNLHILNDVTVRENLCYFADTSLSIGFYCLLPIASKIKDAMVQALSLPDIDPHPHIQRSRIRNNDRRDRKAPPCKSQLVLA